MKRKKEERVEFLTFKLKLTASRPDPEELGVFLTSPLADGIVKRGRGMLT